MKYKSNYPDAWDFKRLFLGILLSFLRHISVAVAMLLFVSTSTINPLLSITIILVGIVFIVRIKPWKEPWKKPKICCLCMTALFYVFFWKHSFFIVYIYCINNLLLFLCDIFIEYILMLNKKLAILAIILAKIEILCLLFFSVKIPGFTGQYLEAMLLISKIEITRYNHQKAIEILNFVIEETKRFNAQNIEFKASYKLSKIFHAIGMYSKSIEYGDSALSISSKYNDLEGKSMTCNLLGNIYSELGKYFYINAKNLKNGRMEICY